MSKPPRIGIVGTFDVANFGDLLFPIVAEDELRRRLDSIALTRYSYRALSAASWPYDVRSIGALAEDLDELDLLLVGGGDLIRFDQDIAAGYRPSEPGIHHPTGYWLLPTLLAAEHRVPVVWNAVGVIPPIPQWARPLLTLAIGGTVLAAVRDEFSVEALRDAAGADAITLVPDTAFGARSSVDDSGAREFLDSARIDGPFLVVQPTAKLLPFRAELEEGLRAAQETGHLILEQPISPAHGDACGLLDLSVPMRSVAAWPGPRALAGVIARANAVVGVSLHLSIAALTSGVPVFRPTSDHPSKYSVLERFADCHMWTDGGALADLVRTKSGARGDPGPLIAEHEAELAAYWDGIAECAAAASSRARRPAVALVSLATSVAEERAAELEFHRQELAAKDEQLTAANDLLERSRASRASLEGRLDETSAALDARARSVAALEQELRVQLSRAESLQAHLDALLATKTFRYSARLRRVYQALRLRRTGVGGGSGIAASPDVAYPVSGAAPARGLDDQPPVVTRNPTISVVIPTFDTDPDVLRRALQSVYEQTYENWELCICDDGSTKPETLSAIRAASEHDTRVKVAFNTENRGISAATNDAIALATGEYVAFLDHDDELAPTALQWCAATLDDESIDALYTDEDKYDENERLTEPFHKPDWSPQYLLGVMYVGHLLVIRRSLIKELGGLDGDFDGVQDYELMLRVAERTDRVAHVARVLYHWRKSPGSIAQATDAKAGIGALQVSAVQRHLGRRGIAAKVRPHPVYPHRAEIELAPPTEWPSVSIVIPTRDAPSHLERCLAGIFSRSTYPRLEVVAVDTGSTDPDALSLLDDTELTVVRADGPFNFSRACNLGVERASGEFVLLLNNDTEPLTPDWIEQLVVRATLPGVGAVAPLLVYPDRTVQHAGVVLGMRGTADHIMRRFPIDSDGYAGSLSCDREVSAVTAACMLVRQELFARVGGFREWYAVHYQDVDLCLRIRRAGERVLFTPKATVMHHEGATRGSDYDMLDRALLLDVWGEVISGGDPYYNPNLSLEEGHSYVPVWRASR